MSRTIHGNCFPGNYSPEYYAWSGMKQRCLNPNAQGFHRYGGRGIKVSSLWINDFPKFLSDVGKRPSSEHSLDRINNNGNYEPGNVKWSTKVEQQRNRRVTKRILYGGENLTIPEWNEKLNFPIGVLEKRLGRGYTIQQAIEIPLEKHRTNLKRKHAKKTN